MRPTRRVLERVLKALDVIPNLPEARLEQVKRDIIAVQQKGTDLTALPSRVLRDAVWILWLDSSDGVDRERLRRAILSHISTRKSMLRRLIDVWLLQFSRDDDSFVDVARQIDRCLSGEHTGMLGLRKETHHAYDLFKVTTGPNQLASRILEDNRGNRCVYRPHDWAPRLKERCWESRGDGPKPYNAILNPPKPNVLRRLPRVPWLNQLLGEPPRKQ
jgi:hypothetical protein